MTDFTKLDVVIPEYSGHHPFSKSERPDFYGPQDLRDFAPGNTLRTNFFEKYLVALSWKLGGPVPYAFRTANNKVRSLDAGCLGFLAHRNPPYITFDLDADGLIAGVLPTPPRLALYQPMRIKLLRDLQPNHSIDGLPQHESANESMSSHNQEKAEKVEYLSASMIEKGFLDRGFIKEITTEKLIGLKHEKSPEYFYLKRPEPNRDSVRRGLVAHPDLPRHFPGILDIPGLVSDQNYYHHSHMRNFPERLHTGNSDQKYGIALDFAEFKALEAFLDRVLSGEGEGAREASPTIRSGGQQMPDFLAGSNYWWVNQKQTLNEEIGGGYLWSPKTSKNGVFNQFYENMRSLDTGDVIFSYAHQKIGHVGRVLGRAISANKPVEFEEAGEAWSNDGWLVRVNWQQLNEPLRPKDFIAELVPTLPAKYSPLRENGDGLQNVYLAAIQASMAELLISKSKELLDLTTEQFAESLESAPEQFADHIEQILRNDTAIDSTERDALVKARRGQGKFRRNVSQIEKACRITDVDEPVILRASHIKPWSLCASNHERLDGNNGLLLTPTFDVLFDRGYLTFLDDGNVVMSERISPDVRSKIGLDVEKSTAPAFNEKQKIYLAFHRQVIFKG